MSQTIQHSWGLQGTTTFSREVIPRHEDFSPGEGDLKSLEIFPWGPRHLLEPLGWVPTHSDDKGQRGGRGRALGSKRGS